MWPDTGMPVLQAGMVVRDRDDNFYLVGDINKVGSSTGSFDCKNLVAWGWFKGFKR